MSDLDYLERANFDDMCPSDIKFERVGDLMLAAAGGGNSHELPPGGTLK